MQGQPVHLQFRDVLEVAAEWNGQPRTASMHRGLLEPAQPLCAAPARSIPLRHVHGDINETIAASILAHGETVGLLHLEYTFDGTETAEEAKARFADRARLGLAADICRDAIMNEIARRSARQSVRDVLTGLNNRRYLLGAARRCCARAQTSGRR
jgi:hypothetical protein